MHSSSIIPNPTASSSDNLKGIKPQNQFLAKTTGLDISENMNIES